MPVTRRQAPAAPPLTTPLSALDPEQLEVIEIDAAGRLARITRWTEEESLHEAPYAIGTQDPGSLAGLWEALVRHDP